MNFERPKMQSSEKSPAPAQEKEEETQEQKDKETHEMFEKLGELENEEYEARMELKDARAKYRQTLEDKIALKDKLRTTGGREGLQGLFTEKDKATLEKLEK